MQRSRAYFVLAVIFIFLQGLDAVTTWYGLQSANTFEANPFVRFFIQHFSLLNGLVVNKVLMTLGMMAVLAIKRPRVIKIVNWIWVPLCLSNLAQIARALAVQ